MNIKYKFKSRVDIYDAIVCKKVDIERLQIKKEKGCIEIAQDGDVLFYLVAGAGDEIEEIRITGI
jgi:hypothetical protein|tara:strand:+ start:358 stop:552 length:195 start_codon:yes stop_codon:yes gene_type:complete